MSLRLLVLSFYYKPDLSAGAFRATALVEALLEEGPPGLMVEVVTTMPNRYGSFTTSAPAEEVQDRSRVRRIALPSHRSGMVDQTRAFLTFARAACRLTRGESYDLVFATTSRLMTAALGATIARRAHAPLYLDIRDIFVDTIGDVLKGPTATVLKPLFAGIERWAIRSASQVNLVSPGFTPYFRSRYPAQVYSCHTNGIDEAFLSLSPTPQLAEAATVVRRVVYAGNMGEGQGLHHIIPPLAQRLEGRVVFKLIGDGGRRRQLEAAIQRAGVSNVELVPPVSRDRLIEEYRNADVLLLHLNDYPAFEKVLPSKVFEYAAMGKPMWAGVAGYAADFIRAELPGAALFKPCSVDAAVAAFGRLTPASAPPRAFFHKYRRRTIMRSLARELVALARD